MYNETLFSPRLIEVSYDVIYIVYNGNIQVNNFPANSDAHLTCVKLFPYAMYTNPKQYPLKQQLIGWIGGLHF